MSLVRLEVRCLRNLSRVLLEPSPGFSVIVGPNGSGKTSLLEAVFLLGYGRSFRTRDLLRVLKTGETGLTVVGVVAPAEALEVVLGVEWTVGAGMRIRVGGQDARSRGALAERFPVLLVDAGSERLLGGGPRERRSFMDWGVFHVEQQFHSHWIRFRRALAQRNEALRRGLPVPQVRSWDADFVDSACALTRLRCAYVAELETALRAWLPGLLGESGEVSLRYRQGWRRELELSEALADSRERDREHGYTHAGPQRADLDVWIADGPAAQVLSRGQRKLMVVALYMGQLAILRARTGKQPTLLLDDLPAELDEERQRRVLALLRELGVQVLVTATDEGIRGRFCDGVVPRMFHVEQGRLALMV